LPQSLALLRQNTAEKLLKRGEILDNYRIHSSKIVNAALAHHLSNITLEFFLRIAPMRIGSKEYGKTFMIKSPETTATNRSTIS